MTKTGGISGTAVGLATAGGFLLYASLRNVNLETGLREILSGKTPTGTGNKAYTPIDVAAQNYGAVPGRVPATGLGARIVTSAIKYLGVPYKTGGASPKGFDCSGLVQYVLREVGVDVPASVRRVRDFVRWSGVTVVAKNMTPANAIKAGVKPGDLVCWDFVHMGIADDIGDGKIDMIHAPAPGQSVKQQLVWGTPTHYLRVNG